MEKITQKYAARVLGVSPQYFNQLLKGKTTPNIKRAKRLAQIMHVSPAALRIEAAAVTKKFFESLKENNGIII